MHYSFIFLAPGFEEVEALTVVDVMRRAGLDIKMVAVTKEGLEVAGAHGIKVVADVHISEADTEGAEWLICPGGLPGATNLHKNGLVTNALTAQFKSGGKIAAICASPAEVLAPLGILDGREATCYPGFEEKCKNAKMVPVPVVAKDTLITANGPATSLRFALAIVANSLGESLAREVADGMLFNS